MNIHLPDRICGDVPAALEREWLVTNGIGGFAAGTVAGALTRRYHGLLLAALEPPLGRRLLVAKLDVTAQVNGQSYPLYTNIWHSGVEEPAGARLLRRFDLLLGVPTWTFQIGAAQMVQRIWMEPGQNVTFVGFELERSVPRVSLSCRLLVNDRDYHDLIHRGEQAFQAQAINEEIIVHPPDCGVPIHVRCVGDGATDVAWHVDYAWCRRFHLPIEAARGLDHVEDHLAIGRCDLALKPGGAATFSIAAGATGAADERGARERYEARAHARLAEWTERTRLPADASATRLTQLVLAADQFVVARPAPEEPDGHTVIAGYPWFTDWGRDTMISLPGLTLATGRPAVARQILRT